MTLTEILDSALREGSPIYASPSGEDVVKRIKEAGFVVLREKSYRLAQERQRVAEALQREAERARESALEWGRAQCQEWRRLSDRCTYLYGVAAKLGATEEQLRGWS